MCEHSILVGQLMICWAFFFLDHALFYDFMYVNAEVIGYAFTGIKCTVMYCIMHHSD